MNHPPKHKPVGMKCLICGAWAWDHRPAGPDKRTGKARQGTNRARTQARELVDFIGVDGEGVTRADGTHDYVLLTVGKHSIRHTEPTGRLTWREIFPFLYECFEENPHAAFVGYYLGYDFTQWLRTLTLSRAESLFTRQGKARRARTMSGGNRMPFPVHVGDDIDPYQWEIDLLTMRRFKIRPGAGTRFNPTAKNHHSWMYICDVGGFFQQSFLKTLKEFSASNPEIVTPEEYEMIKRGKEKRATAVLDDEMERYNLLECELLSRIMPLLNEGFKSKDIVLRREKWFGPGQAAQAWMKTIDAPTTTDYLEKVPDWARDIGWLTYFGGWFEIMVHGHVPGTVHEYDINSAYPEQICELPCLMHGEWTQATCTDWNMIDRFSDETHLTAVHAYVEGRDPRIGAMLHRDRLGCVLRPSKTQGWYWLHELRAALAAGVVSKIAPYEWRKYEYCGCPYPFRAMRDLYNERLKVGKKTARGKSYKLVYNSSYGKTAQSTGSPTFANGIYASLITAGCRTKILRCIATHPHKTQDVVMVATDGIYFRSPHPGLELDGNALGKWDTKTKENMCLFMPGLYWDDEARKALRDGKDAALKSRGVPGRDMARKILAADDLFRELPPGPVKQWPTVPLHLDFSMVTPGQALDRGKWHTCGTVSTREVRTITADPKKKRCHGRVVGGIVVSDPYVTAPEGWISTPYDKRFGDMLEEGKLGEAGSTPDGDALHLAREEIMG